MYKDLEIPVPSFRRTLEAYFEMAKPRITALLVVVAVCAFVVAGGFSSKGSGWQGLLNTLLSVGLLSAGIFILNHWIERDRDALMVRTRARPLPSGVVSSSPALILGLIFSGGGIAYSTWSVNWQMGLVAFLTAVGYLLVYTPLKYKTPFHTALGALPGATPPLAGWLAATGRLDPDALILFLILFLWQFPHFLSIEMIYKDDYAKARVQVLPVLDPSGKWTAFQVCTASLALLLVSWAPLVTGLAGLFYGVGATILGLGFLGLGLRAVVTKKKKHARDLLRASVLYLPLLLLLLIFRF
ncbi:MAG: protoheme IX farnesyltransferase [Spirochaetales bacterium]|nr:protoheme IX farnesyltransferase [Spirochaetales bacterium]